MQPQQRHIATNSIGHGIALTPAERRQLVYIVGKSGSGKSTILSNLAMQDLWDGEGLLFIDPHGDHAEQMIDALPRWRINHTCYLNVADAGCPVGFNPLGRLDPAQHALAAAGIVSAFRGLWQDSWGPRLEHFLFSGVAALLSSPRPSLLDLARLFTDDRFRERLVPRISDPAIAAFWRHEFPSYDKRFLSEAVAPILNKVGQITASPALRAILGQTNPRFELKETMARGGVVIANLAKGTIGERASGLLGSLLLSHLQLVAMARSELAAEDRRPFFVHVDELQSFGTEAVASLLSESRKFGVHFALANQFTTQLSDSVREAVLGNAGTLIVFRVSPADAELLALEFHPLPAHELSDQSPYRAWLRRFDGDQRAIEVSPRLYGSHNTSEKAKAQSRRNFGYPMGDKPGDVR